MFQAFCILEDNNKTYIKLDQIKSSKNEWYLIFLIKHMNQQNHILKQEKLMNIYQISRKRVLVENVWRMWTLLYDWELCQVFKKIKKRKRIVKYY